MDVPDELGFLAGYLLKVKDRNAATVEKGVPPPRVPFVFSQEKKIFSELSRAFDRGQRNGINGAVKLPSWES